MNWLGLAKHTFTFSSTLFDMGSDLANSLNFLGLFNPNTSSNVTSNFPDQQSINYSTKTLCITNKIDHCASKDHRDDIIWGIVSLGIIFLPGFIFGMAFMVRELYNKNRMKILLKVPFIPVFFPFWMLHHQIKAIINTLRKKKIQKQEKQKAAFNMGLEASIESTCQLMLQLFTILNGYPSSSLQKLTILASFLQVSRCAISQDIDHKRDSMKEKELTFQESLVETIYRLPLYTSTIIFRVGSLCLTMAYLRFYAWIPISFLICVLTRISWTRARKLRNKGDVFNQTAILVASNLGTVSIYLGVSVDDERDNDEDAVRFIRYSSIAAFIQHCVILTMIVLMGYSNPNLMNHWSSKCDFPLKPTIPSFYWMFGTVLLMGCYSLTAVLYRTQMMVQISRNKTKEDEKQPNGEIPL